MSRLGWMTDQAPSENPGNYRIQTVKQQIHNGDFGISCDLVSDSVLRRVAICTVGELFGGVERHVLGLLSGLAARGVSAFLLLFHDGELAAQAREQGVEPVILPNQNRSLPATCRLLANMFEQWQVRIVHVHGYKATV